MTNTSVHNSNHKAVLLFFSDMLALNIFPINHKTLKTFSELDEGVFKFTCPSIMRLKLEYYISSYLLFNYFLLILTLTMSTITEWYSHYPS